jgi:hypothetical protein
MLHDDIVAPPASLGDFDFFVGAWRARHHRLVGRLVGSTEWQDFDGSCVMRKILGGNGNLDENVLHIPSGTYEAVTLRLFDPARRVWSIYWIDGRAAALDTPMVGGFADGRGLFYADEQIDGRAVLIRFLWFSDNADQCRWEQAFSTDRGRNWETNWTMRFDRIE